MMECPSIKGYYPSDDDRVVSIVSGPSAVRKKQIRRFFLLFL